jgi:hypothetical protein
MSKESSFSRKHSLSSLLALLLTGAFACGVDSPAASSRSAQLLCTAMS